MLRLLATAALVLMIGGCSDDDTTEPPPPEYYLTITFSPAAVVVPQGGTAALNLRITRGDLYPGTITLTVEGLPANVTGTFVPATLPTGDESVLTIAASPQAALGSCAFTVRASGPGVDPDVTPAISCMVTP